MCLLDTHMHTWHKPQEPATPPPHTLCCCCPALLLQLNTHHADHGGGEGEVQRLLQRLPMDEVAVGRHQQRPNANGHRVVALQATGWGM